MNLRPKSIKIGPYVYAVEYVDVVVTEENPTEAVHGSCDKWKHVIHISTRTSEPAMKVTLWHEIKHAVIDLSWEGDSTKTKWDVETLITSLTALEVQVMRDNLSLMRYLLA